MVKKMSSCSIFISLLCAFWLLFPIELKAQNNYNQPNNRPVATKKEKKPAEIEYPLYNGILVGIDLWGIGSGLLGGDFTSSEVVACVDLKHRFFPTVELGYGKTDEWNETGIHYKSGAPYFRIGMDYNALYKKKHGNMILVGLRYGFSSFNYDIESYELNDPIYGGSTNPNLADNVWGGSASYQHPDMQGSMHWLEFCLGIRACIWKSIYMGLGIKYHFKLMESKGKYGDPWYVPGFGKYGGNSLGIQYTIMYKLPF